MRARIFLTPGELATLTVMQDNRWRVPSEIAQESRQHVQSVRSHLAQLASRRLIERGGWGDSARWGEWRIVQRGIDELAKHNQLELPV